MAEKKIGNLDFRCERFGARQQQRLLLRLGKLFGSAIADLQRAVVKEGDEAERDAAALEVLGRLFSQGDIDEADALVVELSEAAQVREPNGTWEPIVFDHHFQGELLTGWQVAYFVIEVNFRGFFDAAARSGLGAAILSSARANSKH